MEWVPVPVPAPAAGGPAGGRWAVIGAGAAGLAAAGAGAGVEVRGYPGLGELAAAVAAGEPVPGVVLASAGGWAGQLEAGAWVMRRVRRGSLVGVVLGLVQEWLA